MQKLFISLFLKILLACTETQKKSCSISSITASDCQYPRQLVKVKDQFNPCCQITHCICKGQENGVNKITGNYGEKLHSSAKLIEIYEKCTIIKGNLEITYITDVSLKDLSKIFDHLTEVTGYIIVMDVKPLSTLDLDLGVFNILEFKRLRLVRGENLIEGNAILLRQNIEISHFLAPNLEQISNGNVHVDMSNSLCNLQHVAFEGEIFETDSQQFMQSFYNQPNSCKHTSFTCENCRLSFDSQKSDNCWSKNQCQEYTKKFCNVCNSRCAFSRSQLKVKSCCPDNCSSGCSVSSNGKYRCHKCTNLYNNGICDSKCSANLARYEDFCLENDPETGWTCPYSIPLFVKDRECVRKCPRNYMVDEESNICVVCDSDKDPNSEKDYCMIKQKVCPGTGLMTKPNIHKYDQVTVQYLQSIQNAGCETINGNIFISSSFLLEKAPDGTPYKHSYLASLLTALSTVKVITGSLIIQEYPFNALNNFCFLKSLERIKGQEKFENHISLQLYFKSHRLNFCLISLKEIASGDVYIGNGDSSQHNNRGWFGSRTQWNSFFTSQYLEQKVVYHPLKIEPTNACDPNCESGCWSSGPTQCVGCLNYTDVTGVQKNSLGTCVPKCPISSYVFSKNEKEFCGACSSQCKTTCHGPGDADCDFELESVMALTETIPDWPAPIANVSVKSSPCKNYLKIEKTESLKKSCSATCEHGYFSHSFTDYKNNQGFIKTCITCNGNCVGGCKGAENDIEEFGCSDCVMKEKILDIAELEGETKDIANKIGNEKVTVLFVYWKVVDLNSVIFWQKL